MASAPPRTSRMTYTFESFVGGYYPDVDPLILPKQYLSQCQNCLYDKGWLQKTLGRKPLTSAAFAGEVQLLYVFDRPDGTHVLTMTTTTNFYYYDLNNDLWVDISPPGGLHGSVGVAPQAISWLDSVFMTNTIDPIVRWTGVGSATFITGGGAPTACVSICVFASQLFALQPATFPGWEVNWSDFRNPNVWNAGQAGGVALDDTPEPVEAADVLGRAMAIFKQNTIYVTTFVGPPVWFDFTRRDLPGILCRRTLTRVPVLGLFYQGARDHFIFDGLTATPIGKPVRREIMATLNQAARNAAMAWTDPVRGRCYVSLPTGAATTPTVLYTYSYLDGQYMRDVRTVRTGTTWNMVRYLLIQELTSPIASYNVPIADLVSSDIEAFLTSDGNVIGLNFDNVYQDAHGNPIDSIFQTAAVALGGQQDGQVLPVTVYEIVLVGNPIPATLQVTLFAAWGNMDFQAFGPYPVTLTPTPIEYVVPVEVTGLYFMVKVQNAVLGEGFQIKQIRLRSRMRARV